MEQKLWGQQPFSGEKVQILFFLIRQNNGKNVYKRCPTDYHDHETLQLPPITLRTKVTAPTTFFQRKNKIISKIIREQQW